MFKDKIRALREKKYVSQTEVAKIMGVTPTTYHRWETGEREPNFATVNKLAQYFLVGVEELISENPRPDKIKKPTELADLLADPEATYHGRKLTAEIKDYATGLFETWYQTQPANKASAA
ncbi:MAG: helix-turn-helix transcriptional regulator [bacterium]